jgi:hypothetical protein
MGKSTRQWIDPNDPNAKIKVKSLWEVRAQARMDKAKTRVDRALSPARDYSNNLGYWLTPYHTAKQRNHKATRSWNR